MAVEDAKAAFKIWRQKSGLERGHILLEAARIIRVRVRVFPPGTGGRSWLGENPVSWPAFEGFPVPFRHSPPSQEK